MSRQRSNRLSARAGRWPRYRIAAAALAAAAGLILSPGAEAQVSDADAAAIIGEGLGQSLNQAIAGAQQMQRSALEASREIEAARREYWEAVRTGRNVDPARARFAHQLQGKDFLHMWLAIPGGIEAPQYQVFLRMSPVDGGVHAPAWLAFTRWIEATRAHLGAHGDRFIMPAPAEVAEALERAYPAYQEYLRLRDWAEIDRSGLTWPWDADARAQAVMILQRYTNATTAERAERAFAELAEFFGEDRVLAVADRIRTGRRDEMGMLVDPEAIGVPRRWPHEALFQALARRDANTYFRGLLWRHDPQGSKSVADAAREFDRFAWAYGARAVEAAGQSALERGVASFHLVAGQLRTDHPDGRIREAAAFARGVESRDQFEERHRQLLARHDRERLVEASEVVFMRRWDSILRERNHQALRERHAGDPFAMLVELADAGVAAVMDAAATLPAVFALVYDPAGGAAPASRASAASDAALPAVTPARLAGAADGILYGITQASDVFRMHADGSGFEVLHSFHEEQHRSPVTNLRLGSDGLLYGALAIMWETMPDGRPAYRYSSGAIFRLRTDGTGFEVVSGMRDHEVSEPHVLAVDEAGTIYGLAGQTRIRYIREELNRPVRERHQLLFSLSADGSDFRILQEFPQLSRIGPLFDGGDGYLYGLAHGPREGQRGAHEIEIFRIERDHPDPYEDVYEVVHQLREGLLTTITTFGGVHLMLGSDGFLYGAAAGYGGARPQGIVGGQIFRLSRDGTGYQELYRYQFQSSIGVRPLAMVFEGADGMLYGLAREPDRRDGSRTIGGQHYLVRVGRDGGEAEELGPFAATQLGDVLSEAGAGFLLASFDPDATEPASIYRLRATGGQ